MCWPCHPSACAPGLLVSLPLSLLHLVSTRSPVLAQPLQSGFSPLTLAHVSPPVRGKLALTPGPRPRGVWSCQGQLSGGAHVLLLAFCF